MTVLEMAHRVHQDLNDRAGSAAGLTLNQALVLSEIDSSSGRATVSELAQTLGRAVHTLTSAVNGLENKKFVMRHSIKGEDRRIVRIAATQAGSDALKSFRSSIESVIDAVRTGPFDGEPSQEVKHATRAMIRLLTESK
ncbi:MAG: MarR family winged helix-turn-helix transcriptional regulator [Chloroflexi bacterium]|nr:MarR family winged helix-turn-helix transcriptional regulator [Chloroflexota bacterium]